MHNEEPEDLQALAVAESLRHETRDLPTRAFGTGMIWFTVFFFVAVGVAWVFLWLMPGQHTMQRPIQPKDLPPSPILQSNATVVEDMAIVRRNEAQATTSYGRDPKTGAIRIPVDRAIDIVAAKGLPVQGGGQ